MIIVDTNILVYLWIRGEHTEDAEQALIKDNEWCAPYLWRSEFRNVLIGYLRRKQMTFEEIMSSIAEAERQMENHEYHVASASVIETARTSGCTAYDSEYVTLAKQLSLRLVTDDKEVLHKFPDVAISLRNFVAA